VSVSELLIKLQLSFVREFGTEGAEFSISLSPYLARALEQEMNYGGSHSKYASLPFTLNDPASPAV